MRHAVLAVLITLAATAQPVTNNDASCDISVAPAATLLLPFFEVDLSAPAGTGETTIFTVTNSGKSPQIARVTLWTDLAYPVVAFNLHLAGYEAQSINLFDVLGRGEIRGGSESCGGALKRLERPLVSRMQMAFTTGKVPRVYTLEDCDRAGTAHETAIGYATVDVVGDCDTTMPTDAEYFANDIRFDNVLLGDYQQINGAQNFGQGGPMVHIRAIPEGGTPQSRAGDPAFRVNAPRTFYSAYQDPARPRSDARQPLPSLFAARWLEGGSSGFETVYKIWRERHAASISCATQPRNLRPMVEVVRFDEEENPETLACRVLVTCPVPSPYLPSTSLSNTVSGDFPENTQGAVGGWMYMNFDDLENDAYASQAWMTVSMRAENRFSIDFDATYLGNGCSAPVHYSEALGGWGPIGPPPNWGY